MADLCSESPTSQIIQKSATNIVGQPNYSWHVRSNMSFQCMYCLISYPYGEEYSQDCFCCWQLMTWRSFDLYLLFWLAFLSTNTIHKASLYISHAIQRLFLEWSYFLVFPLFTSVEWFISFWPLWNHLSEISIGKCWNEPELWALSIWKAAQSAWGGRRGQQGRFHWATLWNVCRLDHA